jgi:hypothetical protein
MLDVSYHTLQAYLVVASGDQRRAQTKKWPAWVRASSTPEPTAPETE